ncbi:MAG: hypothetical protein JKY08_07975 [Flavobacteriaceae bacterium]|nr:hypothetical protein [Flavobacteriaceae bacterium]
MDVIKKILLRIVIVVFPLTILYVGFQMASEANSRKEHPTDVGLGYAIMLFFVFLILVIGFIIDLIKSIKNRHYKTAIIDIHFLLLFSIPIIYLHCKMGSYCEECFCNGIVNYLDNLG